MERELRAKLEEVGPGKVAWMSRRWRKSISSVRQAEQRNNEEEHGAKRGVRGLYKLGQRILTERLLVTLSAPTASRRIVRMRPSNVCACACASSCVESGAARDVVDAIIYASTRPRTTKKW